MPHFLPRNEWKVSNIHEPKIPRRRGEDELDEFISLFNVTDGVRGEDCSSLAAKVPRISSRGSRYYVSTVSRTILDGFQRYPAAVPK